MAGQSPCASGVGLQTSKQEKLPVRQLLFIGCSVKWVSSRPPSTSANIATSHALSISLSALCTLRTSPASASTCDPIRLHCATKLLDISYGGYYHGATSNKGIQAKDQVGLQDVQVSVDFGHTPTCRYWQRSYTCRLSPDEGYLKQAGRPSTSSPSPIDDL